VDRPAAASAAAVIGWDTMLRPSISPSTAALSCLLGLLAMPRLASADIISDDQAACDGKKAGDACTLRGDAAVCVAKTCGKLDYSNGVPPESIQVPCTVCEVGGEAAPAPTPDPETEKTPEPDKAPEGEAAADDGKLPDTKNAGKTTGNTDKKKQGCSAGGPVSLGSASLGLLILLGLARGRRRK